VFPAFHLSATQGGIPLEKSKKKEESDGKKEECDF
jgi:hypothetical protein